MLKFEGGEWFNVVGKGKVYSFKVTQRDLTSEDLLNQEVEIEGKQYVVTSVEMHSQSKAKLGSNIGLVVKEKVNFQEYIAKAMANKVASKSQLANLFQVAESTIERWATGVAEPLEAMQRYAIKQIEELAEKKN